MRTSNPALNNKTFKSVRGLNNENVMTLNGTATKAFFLTTIVMFVGAASFDYCMSLLVQFEPTILEETSRIGTLSFIPRPIYGMIMGSCLIGFCIALYTIFNPHTSGYTSPFYAVAEGVCLGSFSTIFEYMYPGAVPLSLGITLGILMSLLMVYSTGLIKPSENFKLGVVAATGGVCLFYIMALLSRMSFGVEMPFLHETGPGGIILSLIVVAIASANLVLDFNFIEDGVEQGAPKYMEWYGAFGLMVTLVWLYIEVLKLILKFIANSYYSSSSSSD